MPARGTWPGLTCLDRQFDADYTGDQLDRLFPGADSDELIRDGVLAAAGIATRMRGCVCDLRRPDCSFRVDCERGRYWAKCEEYGRPLELSRAQVQRYRFNWKPWADRMRRTNALAGPDPVMSVGVVHVGNGAAGPHEYSLVLVAPGCERAADVVVPEQARLGGRFVVALHLGSPAEGLPVDALLPLDAMRADLRTIDPVAIELAISGSARAIAAGSANAEARVWGGATLTAKQAAPRLGHSTQSALLKALDPDRCGPEDPLHVLRKGGPGRTRSGRFYSEAVDHVVALIASAGKQFKKEAAQRQEEIRAAKAATAPPDHTAAQRRFLQALSRKEKRPE